jgi:thiaminase
MSEQISSSEDFLRKYAKDLDMLTTNENLGKLKDLTKDGYWIWLIDEYFFLQSLIKLFAGCLSKSHTLSGIKTYSKGINLLKTQLDLFEEKLSDAKLSFNQIKPQSQTSLYVEFINSLHNSDYQTLVFSTWLIFFLYFKVIERNKISNIAFDITQSWKRFEFIEFMEELKNEFDKCLTMKEGEVEKNVENIFYKLKDLEAESWKFITRKIC